MMERRSDKCTKDVAKNFTRLCAHKRDVRRPREVAIDNSSKVLVRVNTFGDRRVHEKRIGMIDFS